jgi:hypothetical protein
LNAAEIIEYPKNFRVFTTPEYTYLKEFFMYVYSAYTLLVGLHRAPHGVGRTLFLEGNLISAF